MRLRLRGLFIAIIIFFLGGGLLSEFHGILDG